MGLIDIFKIKEYKSEIATLQSQNDDLNARLNVQLSVTELDAIKLQELINQKKNILSKLNSEAETLNNSLSSKTNDLNKLKNEVAILDKKYRDLEEIPNLESFGLYTPHYDFATALQFKDKLKDIRDDQKASLREETAYQIFRPMTLDSSQSKGRSMQKKNGKQIVRTFNVECEAAINKVTYSNIERIKDRINRSFDQLNRLNDPNGISLSPKYKLLKLAELHLAFEYENKKQEEKEVLREQREREREEKALQKEILSKQKNIDKEIKHFKTMINELTSELSSKNEQEKQDLQRQIQELKIRINENENQKTELDYRVENSTAGYVYIISNIGSFGKNVLKIGVTRRLDPMERIDELGSASVPFKFDVHALIFSYDAYKLEAELHDKFADKRINKMNFRKEYFNLTIEEIRETLNQYKDLTIDFNEIPEASEYRESLKVTE